VICSNEHFVNNFFGSEERVIDRENQGSRKESRHMCETFQELFKDEIDEKVKAGEKKGRLEGEREGKREGKREGRLETLISLAKDNLITISEATKRADMTEALFTEKMTQFGK
jgi:predicted transposase YdaD